MNTGIYWYRDIFDQLVVGIAVNGTGFECPLLIGLCFLMSIGFLIASEYYLIKLIRLGG